MWRSEDMFDALYRSSKTFNIKYLDSVNILFEIVSFVEESEIIFDFTNVEIDNLTAAKVVQTYEYCKENTPGKDLKFQFKESDKTQISHDLNDFFTNQRISIEKLDSSHWDLAERNAKIEIYVYEDTNKQCFKIILPGDSGSQSYIIITRPFYAIQKGNATSFESFYDFFQNSPNLLLHSIPKAAEFVKMASKLERNYSHNSFPFRATENDLQIGRNVIFIKPPDVQITNTPLPPPPSPSPSPSPLPLLLREKFKRDPATLTLQYMNLNKYDMIAISEVLKEAQLLTSLNLNFNRIDDAGVAALAKAAGEGALPQLKMLSLNDNAFGAEGMAALAVECARGALPELKELHIDSPSQTLQYVCFTRRIQLVSTTTNMEKNFKFEEWMSFSYKIDREDKWALTLQLNISTESPVMEYVHAAWGEIGEYHIKDNENLFHVMKEEVIKNINKYLSSPSWITHLVSSINNNNKNLADLSKQCSISLKISKNSPTVSRLIIKFYWKNMEKALTTDGTILSKMFNEGGDLARRLLEPAFKECMRTKQGFGSNSGLIGKVTTTTILNTYNVKWVLAP